MNDTTDADETQAVLFEASEEVRRAVNDLSRRLNLQLSAAAAARRAGVDATGSGDQAAVVAAKKAEDAARAEVKILRAAFDNATLLAMALNRAIIDALDGAPAIAAARQAVKQTIENLKAEKAAFAASTESLNTAAGVVDGIAGVVTQVRALLGPPTA